LDSWRDQVAIDEGGNVYCFVGYEPESRHDDDRPYFSPSVGARERGGRASDRFIRLERGTLGRSKFLNDSGLYRIIDDRWMVFPTGSQSYFGVISRQDRSEDEALTRAIFGATFEELVDAAAAWGRVMGRHELLLPRVTFSKSRANRCDLTGCLIPKEFPYIAFGGAQYDWGHVSLFGFYRLVSVTCAASDSSPVGNALVEAGIPRETLRQLISNTSGNDRPLPDRS
jgi:hypothetical protein